MVWVGRSPEAHPVPLASTGPGCSKPRPSVSLKNPKQVPDLDSPLEENPKLIRTAEPGFSLALLLDSTQS